MPSHNLHCRCGFDFPVQPEDRGFSVYCPSCAQECLVPADFGEFESAPGEQEQDEPVQPSGKESGSQAVSFLMKPRSTVFSREGSGNAGSRAVGKIACLCGGEAEVYPDDYGSTVYCPSCGAGLEVGERLGQSPSLPARAAAPAVDAPPTRNVAAASARTGQEPGISPVPIVAVVSGLVVAVVLTWIGAAHWPHAKSAVANLADSTDLVFVPPPPPPPIDENNDTASEANDTLDEEPEPFPDGDPADWVTLEKIEELLTKADKRLALVDAQVWRQLLVERDVSASDPRLKRLDEVIAVLTKDLAPKPTGPDPAIEPFRDLLGRLNQALSDEDLTAARQLNEEATQMFRAHAEALAPFSRRLFLQQARLKQLEARIEGLATVERLLKQARSEAEADHVLEALEARATALYRAKEGLVTTAEEVSRLESLATDLREPLRLARGKLAVEDAQRCQDAHDLAARNAQLQLARSLLPGLSESVIKPLIVKVEQLSKLPIAGSRRTPLGRELAARTEYEEALDRYARAELPELVQAAAKATGADAPAEAKQYGERLTRITLEALENRLSAIVAGLVPSDERGAALVALQQACDQLNGWNDDARYQALRAATEQQAGEIAQKALAEAKRLAAKDKLAEAGVAVLPATQLGPPAERAAAEKLRGEWQAEVELRASLPAQAEHWRRIEALADAHDVVAAAREIGFFQQRYPTGPHHAELTALKARLLPQINRELDALIASANKSWDQEQWSAFFDQLGQIAPLAIAAGREGNLQALKEKASQLEARVEGRLEEARRAERMVSDEEIIAVLEATADALAMQPGHPAAKELQKKAHAAAKTRARRLMQRADGLLRNKMVNETYRKLLQSIVKLDREGEHGRQAQLALNDLPEAGP